MHSLPTFSLFAQTPHSLPSLLRLQGLRKLSGFRAAETLWFRLSFCLQSLSLSCHRRMQPMADNYQGRQSRTGGGPIYFTLPFQVPDTRTARGQPGPAARQSCVRIPATDSFPAETRNTSLKLFREADCTLCSEPAKHTDTV